MMPPLLVLSALLALLGHLDLDVGCEGVKETIFCRKRQLDIHYLCK